MSIKNHTVTGVLLAGGRNSRMGTDKGLLTIGRQTIADRTLAALRQVTDTIMIISNGTHYHRFGYPVYSDLISNCGPMGGIYTALNMSPYDWCLVVACDMPAITPELFKRMVRNIGDCDAVVPVTDGVEHPLCALYSTRCLPALQSQLADGKWKMRELLPLFRTTRLAFEPGCFLNVNTPEEYHSINSLHYEHSN